MRLIQTLIAALLLATPALAESDLIEKTSPHDVATTIDRLEQAVTAAGATVIARVDHAAAAEKADLDLRPTQLLIFGNPKVGTLLMQADQRMGVELPMRVAAYQDEDGQVHVVYPDIVKVAAAFGISADDGVDQAAGALEKLTDRAVSAD